MAAQVAQLQAAVHRGGGRGGTASSPLATTTGAGAPQTQVGSIYSFCFAGRMAGIAAVVCVCVVRDAAPAWFHCIPALTC